MWKLLQQISKHLIIAIPVMMLLGFLFGVTWEAKFLKRLIIPFTFLMVYPMMVNLKIKKVFEGGDVKAQIWTQVINFAVIPFVAFGLGLLFFRHDPYMALGMLLAGLVPTSGMTISWTGFAKGNMAAAVKMTVIGLTLGSLATPFYVKLLMGTSLEVHLSKVMTQIIVIVFIPMLAGYITQQGLIKKFGQKVFQQRWAPKFPPLSVLGVIGIVFIAMALKAPAIIRSPQVLLYILAPLSIAYAFNYTLSTVVAKAFLPRGDGIALVYGSVMRNLSIALAIAINAFGPQGSSAALVVAIAYIIQVQSAAWYVKYSEKLFGPPSKEPALAPEKAEPKAEVSKAAAPAGVCEAEGVPSFKKILYATDLSETARHAVKYACTIGEKYGATVTVLHVVPNVLDEFSMDTGIDLADHVDEKTLKAFNEQGVTRAKERIRQRIEEASQAVTRKIPCCPLNKEDIRVEVGNPATRIVSVAEAENYDLVIMGTHGLGKWEEAIVGTVAGGVIRKCRKPVLVVRLPE